MDQFRRHETSARDYLGASAMMGGDGRRSGTPSRFDASFYRSHDALGYIPSDVQSLRSQATYSSGLPMFAANGPFGTGMQRSNGGAKRSNYGYASSIISQDVGIGSTDSASVIGSTIGASSMAYSQSDRLHRRSSFSSMAGTSDLGSLSQYDYKSQDDTSDMDDMKSQYTGTQSGITVF
ncbi:hypothetical protein EW026_g1092 [Hermanssonia centrifuga]|uniref:Uncharacterized protein n=1 Tax=Hermanssonia centrifuga TaxID=98765 RepID=A0A4S4KSU3_9APHY|nr:hypothetical protein EW026_g1092 [Hermanssonia centrifuga]